MKNAIDSTVAVNGKEEFEQTSLCYENIAQFIVHVIRIVIWSILSGTSKHKVYQPKQVNGHGNVFLNFSQKYFLISINGHELKSYFRFNEIVFPLPV